MKPAVAIHIRTGVERTPEGWRAVTHAGPNVYQSEPFATEAEAQACVEQATEAVRSVLDGMGVPWT